MNDRIIIAIGGGELKSKATLGIDAYIANLVKKRQTLHRPMGLFIGTASHDSMPYFNSFRKTYTSEFDIKADCALICYNEMNIEKIADKIKPFYACPDIWLLFTPLKKDCTDFVIEKATELGCRRILPVITEHTNTINIKIDRYLAQSIEAAEQCRRTDIPEIAAPQALDTLLTNWDSQRTLFYMDETLNSPSYYTVLQNNPANKAAVLIGPEGGFSPRELATLHNASFARGATLGSRILRAETAALAALSCWQLISGDWSK